jgi:hypothetical protein
MVGGAEKKEEISRSARTLEADFEREDTEEREKVSDYIGEVERLLDL